LNLDQALSDSEFIVIQMFGMAEQEFTILAQIQAGNPSRQTDLNFIVMQVFQAVEQIQERG